MKKIILGMGILFMAAQSGYSNKDMELMIIKQAKAKKALYKIMRCELEVKYYKTDKADPEICIEAAKSIRKGEDLGPLAKDRKQYLGEAYFNAAIINQFKLKRHKKAFKLYLKAYKAGYCNYDNCSVGRNIGYYYGTGIGGVPLDKVKAYKYFLEATKHGNRGAQNNLDYLCSQSPWACK
jgi:TPR repeat protein